MKRFICIALTVLFSISFPGFLAAQKEKLRVMVVPFEIHAREPQVGLGEQIATLMEKQFEDAGAEIVPCKVGKGVTEEQLKRVGRSVGVDYVIRGSMMRMGKSFSIDARMVEIVSSRPPAVFSAEGGGMDKLFSAIRRLSVDIGSVLFKYEKILNIEVKGNKRIETAAVLNRIASKKGYVFSARRLAEDLKDLYGTGWFENIIIDAEDSERGKTIIFKVYERPTVRAVLVKGNREFDDEEILDNISLKTGDVLRPSRIKKNTEVIAGLYKEKNYHGAKVTYNIGKLEGNAANVEYEIVEGNKSYIAEITFAGNKHFSEDKLKKAMETSEKGFFSWLTSSGDLNEEMLRNDMLRIDSLYKNNGYIFAKIGEPEIIYKKDSIHIALAISEGDRFKVGKVDLAGDLFIAKEKLMKQMETKEGKFFNRDFLRRDIQSMKDRHSDEGYLHVQINPVTREDEARKIVDVTYHVAKGAPIYIEKIIIEGNTRTRDKIIRREFDVYEGELYRGGKLKLGVHNLNRLDYFEDVTVDEMPGEKENTVNVKVKVKEKPTGMFTFGGGYSSREKLYGVVSVEQRNLFGKGQRLKFKGMMGGVSDRFSLSFTEPWLFDIPLSAGFDVFNWNTDYDDYDKGSVGAGLRAGYRIFDYTSLNLSYLFEEVQLTDIEPTASTVIKEMDGRNIESSMTCAVNYDSRNRLFNPTQGMELDFSVQYSGLGGDISFTKYRARAGRYFPLFWKVTGFVHGKAGYVEGNSEGKLPTYERFHLGGMNSLRGFDWEELSPKDENGAKIGGNRFVQFNFETIFPLFEEAGLMGVLFFDTGGVYDNYDNMKPNTLRESAGFGFRWYSPIGPIRIESGYILDPREGEGSGGRWEFSMGEAF